MTFQEFQKLNKRRSTEMWNHDPTDALIADWPLQNWALAIAGEAGELCNLVKKVLRGDLSVDEAREELAAELADVITYADLMMSALHLDTGSEVLKKFGKVSKRHGWTGAR